MNNSRRDFFKKLGFALATISTGIGISGIKDARVKNLQIVPSEPMVKKTLKAKWSVEAEQDLQCFYNLRVEDLCIAKMSR